jgi:hypothetical protein
MVNLDEDFRRGKCCGASRATTIEPGTQLDGYGTLKPIEVEYCVFTVVERGDVMDPDTTRGVRWQLPGT